MAKYHYDYHRDRADVVKVLHRAKDKAAEDFIPIPTNYAGLLWSGARELFYFIEFDDIKCDYYCLIDFDSWIINKDFIHNSIKWMGAKEKNVLLSHSSGKVEHFKYASYGKAQKYYGIPEADIRWSAPQGVIFSRDALYTYYRSNKPIIWQEVDLYCCNYICNRVAQNPFINVPGFTIGSSVAIIDAYLNKTSDIIHSIKNYEVMRRMVDGSIDIDYFCEHVRESPDFTVKDWKTDLSDELCATCDYYSLSSNYCGIRTVHTSEYDRCQQWRQKQ